MGTNERISNTTLRGWCAIGTSGSTVEIGDISFRSTISSRDISMLFLSWESGQLVNYYDGFKMKRCVKCADYISLLEEVRICLWKVGLRWLWSELHGRHRQPHSLSKFMKWSVSPEFMNNQNRNQNIKRLFTIFPSRRPPMWCQLWARRPPSSRWWITVQIKSICSPQYFNP